MSCEQLIWTNKFNLKDVAAETIIPITVIKRSTQSHVRTQSTSEIDEGIVVLRQVNFML